ncbi:VLTF-3 late transcription factor 3 [Choristoneura rosaceana entomopoxvirus 'L']|uniref:Viral late gene transcription factor 3 n=1 Tax=Choristoneura rosaceana entomopoxvirus 'L' TaxID=1293539 RepID=A0ABM9QKP9_9POXV|nr:VLTF-3 late transcription factor 3 [Choristoneura rosaceana entomopoxvirus 'L']CCU56105.1 VLTF-3 late transcription factor 3 [Choristoneura rosaceana entomopoxvirus 'L']
MSEVLKCKYCNSFNIIKNKDIYSCCDCSNCYTTSSKRITTISSPSNNKTIHCNNVLKEISNTSISCDIMDGFIKLVNDNNLNMKSVTTTLCSEYLKSKGIKNYRTTHKLINMSISDGNTCKLSKDDIFKINIIFEDFTQFIYKNNYTKTISYEFCLDRIFDILNINYVINFNYSKLNKRDDKPEIWNKYIIELYNKSLIEYKDKFIFRPNNIILNEYINKIPILRNIK